MPMGLTAGQDAALGHGLGQRAQQAVEALGGVGAERPPRRQVGLVGAQLDRVPERPAGLGGLVGAAGDEQAPLGEARLGRVPLVVGPAPRHLEHLPRRAGAGGGEHVALAAVDVGGQQGGVVAVAAVLPQQREGLPERQVGLIRPFELQVGGEEGSTGGGGGLGRPAGQVGGFRHLGAVEHRRVVERRPERSIHADEAGRPGVGGRRHRPDLGDGAGHEGRREVVERGRDDGGARRPERRRPGGEVPPPEAAQPAVLPRGARLGSEVAEGVDGLAHRPHPPGGGGVECGTHPADATRRAGGRRSPMAVDRTSRDPAFSGDVGVTLTA